MILLIITETKHLKNDYNPCQSNVFYSFDEICELILKMVVISRRNLLSLSVTFSQFKQYRVHSRHEHWRF